MQLAECHGSEIVVWGLVVCGKGRRRRTSHLAAVSWERLSSLVFAVSLSITATAPRVSSLYLEQGRVYLCRRPPFCTFCSSLQLSFPLFLLSLALFPSILLFHFPPDTLVPSPFLTLTDPPHQPLMLSADSPDGTPLVRLPPHPLHFEHNCTSVPSLR